MDSASAILSSPAVELFGNVCLRVLNISPQTGRAAFPIPRGKSIHQVEDMHPSTTKIAPPYIHTQSQKRDTISLPNTISSTITLPSPLSFCPLPPTNPQSSCIHHAQAIHPTPFIHTPISISTSDPNLNEFPSVHTHTYTPNQTPTYSSFLFLPPQAPHTIGEERKGEEKKRKEKKG